MAPGRSPGRAYPAVHIGVSPCRRGAVRASTWRTVRASASDRRGLGQLVQRAPQQSRAARRFLDIETDTHLDHRLGAELGLLTHSRAETTREEHGFHDGSSNLKGAGVACAARGLVELAKETWGRPIRGVSCYSAVISVDDLSDTIRTALARTIEMHRDDFTDLWFTI
jgi:hypothetical protein